VDDERNEIRQRHLERMDARLRGPEMNDEQSKMRERRVGHGVAWGASLGLAVGAGLGVALGNFAWGIGIGLSIGTGIGIALGAVLGDKNARSGG
jgi:hypothetical protein